MTEQRDGRPNWLRALLSADPKLLTSLGTLVPALIAVLTFLGVQVVKGDGGGEKAPAPAARMVTQPGGTTIGQATGSTGTATSATTPPSTSSPASTATTDRSAGAGAGLGGEVASTVATLLPTSSSGAALPAPLAAPAQVAPEEGAVFDQLPRTVTLTWEPVLGADRYVVEVQSDCCGGWRTLRRETVAATSLQLEFPGAHRGRWRVWASLAGAEGARSPWRHFRYTV